MTSFSDLRNRLGYSQKELAKNAGVRPETISRIESGRTSHKSTLKKIAVALKVSEAMVLDAISKAT
jgi:transcriptional regulator with XRE-family HTH domain